MNALRGLSRALPASKPWARSLRASAPVSAVRHASTGVSPLVVVLDMDECLIHSTDLPASPHEVRQHEESRRHAVDAASRQVQSFRVAMADNGVAFTVLKREGVDEFLKACLGSFETHVFTAGTEPYASPILDELDPEGRLAGRFYRQHCRPVLTAQGPIYLKDLSVIARFRDQGGEDFPRMVLVDNNPLSFVCQPRNGILVPDFVGKPDDVLPQVMDLLKELDAGAEDVRPVLNSIFGLEAMLANTRQQLGLSKL